MTVEELLTEYAESYFHKRDFIPAGRVLTPSEKNRAVQEYDANPLACLEENLEQSKLDARETAARLRLAKQDGILDRSLFESATKEQKKRWRGIVATLRGDHARALSELDHWRGYVGREIERQRSTAPAPDRRLPPEPDELLF